MIDRPAARTAPADATRSGALAVVLRRDRVLLARRSNPPDAGLWGYPGGHVERGETARAAAVRELAEETSILARPAEELATFDVVQSGADGSLVARFRLTAVLCLYVAGAPRAGDDVSEAAWIAQADVRAGRLAMSAEVGRILRLAVEATRR